MSFLTTAKKALRYPNLAQAADLADIVQKLAQDVDDYTAGYTQGLFSARPAAGKLGQLYYATNTNALYLDDGSTWHIVGAQNLLGLLANLPTASAVAVGTEYFATDQVAKYISDGSTWTRVGIAAGAVSICLASTADAGCILLTGQAWPGTTGIYADLYARLGAPATVPDLGGFIPVGRKSGDADFGTLLATLGEKTHTLTAGEMAHDHQLPMDTSSFPSGSSSTPLSTKTGPVIDVSASGHNNIQPSKVVNFQAKL